MKNFREQAGRYREQELGGWFADRPIPQSGDQEEEEEEAAATPAGAEERNPQKANDEEERRMKTCNDCTLWVPEHASSTRGGCHCNPLIITTRKDHWCGQHRGKAGRPVKEKKE